MKLRNKNTGEVIKVYNNQVLLHFEDGKYSRCYHSLAELNAEWEDAKEPLIEHDDARKAFFNWASTNQVHEVICEVVSFANGVELTRFIATEYISNPTIEFKLLDANVKNGGRYTIAELCGEEE